jgi:adenosylcobinamide-phosphate synthase
VLWAGVPWQVMAAALLLALAIDHVWGEPAPRWHPVVWMGRGLDWAAARFVPQLESADKAQNFKHFWLGALYWIAQAAIVFVVTWLLSKLLARLSMPIAAVLLALLLKPMLAWRMLREEVMAVEAALAQSLDAGRTQLARLVSRDVSQLSATQVRESAMETLAENSNDSVVAPIFWFVLLGLPGAALYRFANTADAMWGYPGMRGGRYWQWAGKWAARADDVLSWLPARITAALMLLRKLRLLAQLPAEAACTPSPNSGWPMAAMALSLGVRLAKPGVYVLNAAGREVVSDDMPLALKLASNTVLAQVIVAQAAIFLIVL